LIGVNVTNSLLLLPPITSHNISAPRSRIRRGLQRRDRDWWELLWGNA